MKRTFGFLIAIIPLLMINFSCSNTGSNTDTIWPEVSYECKPWTRWWWMGSAVDTENIAALMSRYADAGFGGVEITPIYGVKGAEDRYIEFLSPEWMNMLKTSVEEAGVHDMKVDMNLGTGWPFGGPQITPEYAASRLIIQQYKLAAWDTVKLKIVPDDPKQVAVGATLEALTAYSEGDDILHLEDKIDEEGNLNWMPEYGEWDIYAAFCGKTLQKVKRAAPGGEGYTMDHFSREALDVYLDRFNKAFNGYRGVRSFFNDSYEVYNASWTPGFFDEFQVRRNYDLRDHLDELASRDTSERMARLKSDYRETMSELLLENFTAPWTDWTHQQGAISRNQAHGSPGNLIDLYATVDIPECEIFGHSNFDIPGLRKDDDDTRNVEPNPMMLKLATSAAHVTGKPLISNETFTWLGEHFKVALSQCKPEVELAFLAGINHVFYHGTTYSPEDAAWPGWLFYASVNFAPSNSFWPHLNALNTYVTRCQSLLQSGMPDNEILVYWPIYDIWNNPRGMDMQITVHNIMDWLVYPGIEKMADAGYSYDFISDRLLINTKADSGMLKTTGKASTYRILVIPECRMIPLETFSRILELARSGCTVIFEALPGDVPGLYDLEERREQFSELIGDLDFRDAGNNVRVCPTGSGKILLSPDIENALAYAGVSGENIRDYGLKFTRRKMDDGKCYYLVNHSALPVDTMLPLNTTASGIRILDPQDGRYGRAYMEPGAEKTLVRVQLQPGEAIFLRTYDKSLADTTAWRYIQETGNPIEINGKCKLEFLSGGPEIPAAVDLDSIIPWTDLKDSAILRFSGLARYTIEFDVQDLTADEYMLDPGKIYESARIKLNGKELGTAWSIPGRLSTGGNLVEGHNILEIEVANLMANRIRYMDRHAIPWRIFREINFVNILYRPFDASGWEVMPSGLAGPVKIVPVTGSDK